MNRRVAIGLASLVALGALLFFVLRPSSSTPEPEAQSAPVKEDKPAEEPKLDLAPSDPVTPAPSEAAPEKAQRFDLLEDGSPVPDLPADAPKQVKLAVALFVYNGVQGVPSGSRTREAALELARGAIQAGQAEFAKVLEKADRGSRDDIGWIRRGVLERRVEYEVFRLGKGEVTRQPIDTPRGFWVVRRIQ